ncbi:MAG: iron ABC transporter permease, partial [Enterococcus casseliflavus]
MSVGLIKSNRWMVSTIICCVLVVAILLSAGVALANGQANITLGEVYQILFYKISHGLVG